MPPSSKMKAAFFISAIARVVVVMPAPLLGVLLRCARMRVEDQGRREGGAAPTDAAMERRLAAILSVDVTEDKRDLVDGETHSTRSAIAYRKFIEALVEQHLGCVVAMNDDTRLALFPSVIEALQCALVLQATIVMENAHLAPGERARVHMGLHLGDVLVQDRQAYGQGVTIAAGLRELAEPGGICLSAAVYEQVKGRIAIEGENLGTRKVRNSPELVQVYLVRVRQGAPSAPSSARGKSLSSWLPLWEAAGVFILLMLSLILIG